MTLDAEWKKHTEDANWDKQAVNILINFLFPGWSNAFTREHLAQGIVRNMPTDYWVRLVKEEIPKGALRDQEVIKALESWKRDRNTKAYKELALAEAIMQTEGFATKVEQFGMFLNGDEVRSIASDLFKITLEKEKAEANENVPGFSELWRLSLDKPSASHDEWVFREICKAFPISLRFSVWTFYFWRHDDRNSLHIKQQKTEWRNKVIKKAKEVYWNEPDALIKAIDPAYMYSILQFAVTLSSSKEGGPGFNPEDWYWLADVLVDAGEKNAQVIVPQIACLVTGANDEIDPETRRLKRNYSFKDDGASELFRENLPRVMSLLAQEIDTSIYNTDETERLEVVRQKALEWLRTNEKNV